MYKIEFVPRYGTTLGIISKTDEEGREDTIGHVRLSDENEEKRWMNALESLNQELAKEIKKRPPQRLEQDIY